MHRHIINSRMDRTPFHWYVMGDRICNLEVPSLLRYVSEMSLACNGKSNKCTNPDLFVNARWSVGQA